jgi:drug/metabolite transporter (DMT)-like permease
LLAILVVNRQENPKLFQVVGLVLGFFGVLVVLGAWRGLGENPFWAVAILFAAVTCYGISYPYIRRFVMPLNLQPESIVAAQLLLGAITLAPLLIFGGVEKYELQLVPILAMLALGIFGSGVAYLWNFKVMQLAGSAIASTVTYLTPLVAIAAGVIFLGEQVTWNEPVGALIVLLGAAIAQERISLRKREANR